MFAHRPINGSLLPQKTSRQNERASPSSLRHNKMPFVAGTVSQFCCSDATTQKNTYHYYYYCCCVLFLTYFGFLPVTVDEPKPLSPRQCTKYPSHDEAPSASAVWANERSAQICLWSQEKPPKGLFSTFQHLLQTWRGARPSRTVTGLAVWPAVGSAGRARTDELVS